MRGATNRGWPGTSNGYFAEMGRIAVDIGRDARGVVLSGDPDKAAKLAEDDDARMNFLNVPNVVLI